MTKYNLEEFKKELATSLAPKDPQERKDYYYDLK
jgi:hypothetical protein